MAEDDIPKTAICTPFGLFEYIFMPFGLKNAAQTFQRLMDKLFRHLPFVFVYLDDILIASKDIAEHMRHLRLVFEILQDAGLQINPAKCTFSVSSLTFLGHNVDAAGISPMEKHVKALTDFPPPSDLKQLQRFLGLINFYRRFLPGIAGTLQPLTDLLRGNPKTLVWTEGAAAAFCAAKDALTAATVLAHPLPGAIISLATDASDTHIGGVLQQLTSGSWRPLAFFSRKLSPAESKYSTFDRELLAVFAAIRHFRFVLEGRPFRILTDHLPLTLAMRRVSPLWSARQVRQLAYISEFSTDIRHTPGLRNVVADALSRPSPPPPPVTHPSPVGSLSTPSSETGPPADQQPPAIDYAAMAAAQLTCTDCSKMCDSKSLFITAKTTEGVKLFGDISTGVFRPLVPPEFRESAAAAVHGVAHPGVEATVRLVTSKFCWPGIRKYVRRYAQHCLSCQKSKVSRHVHLAPEVIAVPRRRFEHIHVDIVGPLPQSSGFSYLFTVVDRTTRWPEAVPLSSTAAADCAAALFSGWIQRFGVPSVITSDRGAQFTSNLWTALCTILAISHVKTTAYHPQSNGLVERFHRRLKEALQARSAGPDWLTHLPWVLLGIRTAVPLEGGPSPAEAVMGCQPILPGEFLSTGEAPLEEFLEKIKKDALLPPRPVLHKNTPLPDALPPDLAAADFVFIRRDSVAPPLTPPYTGPFKVLRRTLHTFQVQVGTRMETISTHRLKACISSPDTAAAEPPRRGRPPLSQPGAKTPHQNPGEKTSSKNQAEADRTVKTKKCPQSVKTKGKNPRFRAPLSSSAPSETDVFPPLSPPPPAGRPAGVSDNACSDRAAKSAGKTKNLVCTGTGTGISTVPQSILRKKNQGSPRAAAAHSGPAFDPMGARLGSAKSVRFSCGKTIIPQVFNPAPPTSRPHPDPDPISVSGRPRRVRRSPDRLGISVDPLGSPLGGEL
jgi:cleavage and polyadenylation specificity factor subunit 1